MSASSNDAKSASKHSHKFVEEIRRRVEQVLTREQLRFLDVSFFSKHCQPGNAELKWDRKRAIESAVDERIRNGMIPKAAYSEVSEEFGLKPGTDNGPVERYYREYVREIERTAWVHWELSTGALARDDLKRTAAIDTIAVGRSGGTSPE